MSVVAIGSFGVEPTDKERLLIEALGNVLVQAGMLLPGPMSGPEVLAHAGTFCDDAAAGRQGATPDAIEPGWRQSEGVVVIAATAFYQEGRAFFRIGNYEFEVVVSPVMSESMGPAPAAESLTELLQRQLDELVSVRDPAKPECPLQGCSCGVTPP